MHSAHASPSQFPLFSPLGISMMDSSSSNTKILCDTIHPPPSLNIPPLNIYALENQAVIAIEFNPTKSKRSLKLKKLFDKSSQHKTRLTNVRSQINEYFLKERKSFTFPIALYGTPFQESVWNALLSIPYGKIVSYKYIGEKVASQSTSLVSRAVGQAVGSNPISIVIPCHRILRIDGNYYRIGNYGGGVPTKKTLLAHEKAYQQNPIRV